MKLYTEEQVREILMSINTYSYILDSDIDDIIDSLTPSNYQVMSKKETAEKDYSQFIGKRISVVSPRWPKERLVGNCTFAGIGFSGDFQVTIDRLPIWPVDPNDIKIIKDKINH